MFPYWSLQDGHYWLPNLESYCMSPPAGFSFLFLQDGQYRLLDNQLYVTTSRIFIFCYCRTVNIGCPIHIQMYVFLVTAEWSVPHVGPTSCCACSYCRASFFDYCRMVSAAYRTYKLLCVFLHVELFCYCRMVSATCRTYKLLCVFLLQSFFFCYCRMVSASRRTRASFRVRMS